jgi:hypothetical protein
MSRLTWGGGGGGVNRASISCKCDYAQNGGFRMEGGRHAVTICSYGCLAASDCTYSVQVETRMWHATWLHHPRMHESP